MTLKKYLILHLSLTAIVCVAVIFPVLNMYGADYLWLAYLAVGMTSLGSLLAFVLVFRALGKSFQFFLNFVVGGMFSKMLAGIIAIVSLAMTQPREKLIFFTILFLLSYLVFTTLEVTSLMRKNKQLTAEKKEIEKISDSPDKNS